MIYFSFCISDGKKEKMVEGNIINPLNKSEPHKVLGTSMESTFISAVYNK